MKVILFIAAIIDLALAALLVAVSGFMFGGGAESMHAGSLAAAVYIAAVVACIAAPVIGFVLIKRGNAGPGAVVSFLPPVVALIASAVPAPY